MSVETRRKLTQVDILVAIADFAEVFRTPDGETVFATIEVDRHHETWPVRSRAFRRWLGRRFFELEHKPHGAQALQDALAAIEARAQFGGAAVHKVFTRVAERHNRAIYLDLVDQEWSVVEITASGWRLLNNSPVKFRRSRGMLALPRPVPGGSLKELHGFLNLRDDDQWALVVGWLLAAARPAGPYPVLVLGGEQGTAKTTMARVLRALVDPNMAPVRAEPRDVRDLMIAASHSWALAYDNISHLSPWLSDAICRLSTGGGFSTRELYENDEEFIFEAQRPVILNGIDDIVTRADLLDRALLLDLPVIQETKRRSEGEFWGGFESARPQLLGALFDAISMALRRAALVRLPTRPRMADFAIYVTAAAPALGWEDDYFVAVYADNRSAATEVAVEATPVGPLVRAIAEEGDWTGTAANLLALLDERVDEKVRKAKTWPTTPVALSGILRRLAPNLRALGVEVIFQKETKRPRRRLIMIKNTGANQRLERPDRLWDAGRDATQPEASPRNPAPDKGGDARDDGDAKIPGRSGDTGGDAGHASGDGQPPVPSCTPDWDDV